VDITSSKERPGRVVPTLESLSDSQIQAIRSIPSHEDAVDRPLKASRPAEIFLGQERFDLEQEKVFNALPVPLTMSAVVPNKNDVVAIDSYGKNILVTRAKDGKVRAFINACGHKGAKLIEDDQPQSTSRLVCPYHAWTFGLDGRVIGVPRAETFEGLCKDDRALRALACEEKGGIIWAGLDPKREYDFSCLDDELAEDFEAFNLPRMHLYGRKQFDLKANWKLVLEPFLEGYHVQRLHANTVGPLFADVPNRWDLLGRNIRQVSGKANYEPSVLEQPGENIHKTITHAYQVFPNLVLVTSPYYISIMIIAPRAPDRTIVDYMMLTREAPDNEKAHKLFSTSYEMILNVFGTEDYRAAEISHEGLASGGLDDLLYCGLEEMVPLYYGVLEEQLGV